ICPCWPPPRQAMQLPSTMIGDDRVKKVGQAFVSFRHTSLPVAASRQERTPATPNVQIFPAATAGELRGPAPSHAIVAPVTARAAYLSCHRSFPVVASRDDVTSSPP